MMKICDLILPGNYGQRPCSGNNFIKGKARKERCLSKTPFLTFVCTSKWNIWVNCSQNVQLYILWHYDIWLLCVKKSAVKFMALLRDSNICGSKLKLKLWKYVSLKTRSGSTRCTWTEGKERSREICNKEWQRFERKIH